MASARSGGRAGPRAEEANGDLDRSLQQMLRAIAEERSRAGLRQEISGLGESGRAGSERGVPGRGTGNPAAPPRPRAGAVLCVPVPQPAAVAWRPVGWRRAAVLRRGWGPSAFRSRPPAEPGGSSGLSAPLSAVPLEKNGPEALRASAAGYRYVFKHKLRASRLGIHLLLLFPMPTIERLSNELRRVFPHPS